VVTTTAAGRLMERRDAPALVSAWQALMREAPTRAATRQYAEGYSWDATTQGQRQLFTEALHAAP
jgi:teichuronic acid biosynthesis glycosyltransferase TuaC